MGIARGPVLVGHDTVVAVQACLTRQSVVRHHADRDHQKIGPFHPAINGRLDMIGGFSETRRASKHQARAVMLMQGRNHIRHDRGQDTGTKPLLTGKERDVESSCARRRGDFEPEPAPAQDKDRRRIGQSAAQRLCIIGAAQGQDAAIATACLGNDLRRAASGKDQTTIGIARAATHFDGPGDAVNPNHGLAKMHLHVKPRRLVRRQDLRQRQPGRFGGDEGFRQRRAFVRGAGLVTEKADLPTIAKLPQRPCGRPPRLPRAHDDHRADRLGAVVQHQAVAGGQKALVKDLAIDAEVPLIPGDQGLKNGAIFRQAQLLQRGETASPSLADAAQAQVSETELPTDQAVFGRWIPGRPREIHNHVRPETALFDMGAGDAPSQRGNGLQADQI